MASGEQMIAHLADVEFRGKVGEGVTEYAKRLQAVARAFGGQFDNDGAVAERALWQLARKSPQLGRREVRIRARRVTRHFRRMRDLSIALSAEAVKFHHEYEKQFHGAREEPSRRSRTGGVDF